MQTCDLCEEKFNGFGELCQSCQKEEDAAKVRFEQEQAIDAIVKNTTPEGVHPFDPSVVEHRRELVDRSRRSVRRSFSIY